jgi:flagellar biosynthesis/type III secretory pathway protein FliH
VDSSAEGKRRGDVIEAWEYPRLPDPDLPDWEAWGGGASVPSAPPTAVSSATLSTDFGFEKRLEEETRRSFDAGHAKGVEQGRSSERAAQGTAQQRLDAQIECLVASFAEQRDRYLQTVEHEVVALSLAVAARILRREAQMDPLLLTGAVRVALGQLAKSTTVRLRVPPADLDLWKESIALLPNLAVKPQVVPGDGMRLGDCMVETELGSVDLGVRAQLSEIERGFFDRATSAASTPELALVAAERDS